MNIRTQQLNSGWWVLLLYLVYENGFVLNELIHLIITSMSFQQLGQV
jgi:hypothetical protein